MLQFKIEARKGGILAGLLSGFLRVYASSPAPNLFSPLWAF
ncbi:hypothetical protein HMPREF1249_0621 [Jonquetella sp. BV3C21]|nr:hypothetical protein GCWU000246_01066 [Jonquetella anthropi E3_33 E1]ERL23674.1 hypothetical protein HMPREF1249_0621 [Jonquetella sp. BV3C21]